MELVILKHQGRITTDKLDGLNYLSDKTLNEIDEVTLRITMEARDDRACH